MFLLIVVMLAIALFEVPKLLRQKQFGELFAFAALWGSAFAYAVAVVLRVELPTVLNVLKFLYAFVGVQ